MQPSGAALASICKPGCNELGSALEHKHLSIEEGSGGTDEGWLILDQFQW